MNSFRLNNNRERTELIIDQLEKWKGRNANDRVVSAFAASTFGWGRMETVHPPYVA